MHLPDTLAINAWTGTGTLASPIGSGWKSWVSRERIIQTQRTLAAHPLELCDWKDPQVGWGLILSENPALSSAELATAVDAPPPIQKLLASRAGAPVFRYRPELGPYYLGRHYPDGKYQDTSTSGGVRGTSPGALPYYLLIYGSPAVIPWSLQYALNGSAFAGRLDLTGQALTNYVDALIAGWPEARISPQHPVIWTVDHGRHDITHQMRQAIAEPLRTAFDADPQIQGKLRYLGGAQATAAQLGDTLSAEPRPALIVTTSHGMTGPSGDPAAMAHNLGLPVDQQGDCLYPETLLKNWQPDGAIWYSLACCSAGSDSTSNFTGLFDPTSSVGLVLGEVAGLGARVAPLPRALLGAEKPLRAFIGHVEPTFDWTLQQPETGQELTHTLCQALYTRMHKIPPDPVAMAFKEYYREAGAQFGIFMQSKRDIANGQPDARARALRSQLTGLDRQSLVVLGDPTACIPELPSTR